MLWRGWAAVRLSGSCYLYLNIGEHTGGEGRGGGGGGNTSLLKSSPGLWLELQTLQTKVERTFAKISFT